MAQRKPYNPNTAYGRRKMRVEHEQWKASLPPEERARIEGNANFWTVIVIIIICIIVFLIAGGEGLFHFLGGRGHLK